MCWGLSCVFCVGDGPERDDDVVAEGVELGQDVPVPFSCLL